MAGDCPKSFANKLKAKKPNENDIVNEQNGPQLTNGNLNREEGLGNSNFPANAVVGEEPRVVAKGEESGLVAMEGLEKGVEVNQPAGGAVFASSDSSDSSGSSDSSDSTNGLLTVDEEESSNTNIPDAQLNLKRTVSELSNSDTEAALEKRGRTVVDQCIPLMEVHNTPIFSTQNELSFLSIDLQSTPKEQRANLAFRRTGSQASPPTAWG